jgi:SAM-dependent methyltransferase
VLDVGCGHKPYQDWFTSVSEYIGLDITTFENDPDILADGTILPFECNTFDNVVVFQVLEHIKNPRSLLDEIERILKPGGRLFLSTNQSWPLHEEPHDYYRYTRYGLRYLINSADLDPEEMIEIGNTQIRSCIELNYLISTFAGPISPLLIALVNMIFLPFRGVSFREDYYKTGVIAQKPSNKTTSLN